MRQFVSSMSGWMVRHTKSILRWIQDRLSFWWKNTALEAIRVVCGYDYRSAAGAMMWALRKRWVYLLDQMPSRRKLRALEEDYSRLYDEWTVLDHHHHLLWDRYSDLMKEVKDWESRHAKIMNYVEKKMELDDTWGK